MPQGLIITIKASLIGLSKQEEEENWEPNWKKKKKTEGYCS
jgi:hypothetical protein